MFICDFCDKSFTLKVSYITHTKSFHLNHFDDMKSKLVSEKKFNCDCGKNFNKKYSFKITQENTHTRNPRNNIPKKYFRLPPVPV